MLTYDMYIAEDINIGGMSVLTFFFDGRLQWQYSSSKFMPHITS